MEESEKMIRRLVDGDLRGLSSWLAEVSDDAILRQAFVRASRNDDAQSRCPMISARRKELNGPQKITKGAKKTGEPCCDRDHNHDGNCDVHASPGVLRQEVMA
jgi:hypothetical protein